MEQNQVNPNPSAGKNLGVAALVIGIVSALFSFIPCLGMWAFIPAVVGIILAVISMKQAGPTGEKGMAIGGLITSIIALLISAYWLYAAMFITAGIGEAFDKAMENDSLKNAFKQAADSINAAMDKLKELTDTTQNK